MNRSPRSAARSAEHAVRCARRARSLGASEATVAVIYRAEYRAYRMGTYPVLTMAGAA